jgi:hypothetical protein
VGLDQELNRPQFVLEQAPIVMSAAPLPADTIDFSTNLRREALAV